MDLDLLAGAGGVNRSAQANEEMGGYPQVAPCKGCIDDPPLCPRCRDFQGLSLYRCGKRRSSRVAQDARTYKRIFKEGGRDDLQGNVADLGEAKRVGVAIGPQLGAKLVCSRAKP